MMDSLELADRAAEKLGGHDEYVKIESFHQVVKAVLEVLAEDGYLGIVIPPDQEISDGGKT